MKKVEEKILHIANLIFENYGYEPVKKLSTFLQSPAKKYENIGLTAINIYNYITNSEHEIEEFIDDSNIDLCKCYSFYEGQNSYKFCPQCGRKLDY